jgi:hypothetical protein
MKKRSCLRTAAVINALAVLALSANGASAGTVRLTTSVHLPPIKPIKTGGVVGTQHIQLTNAAVTGYRTYHGEAGTTGGTPTDRQRRQGETGPLK